MSQSETPASGFLSRWSNRKQATRTETDATTEPTLTVARTLEHGPLSAGAASAVDAEHATPSESLSDTQSEALSNTEPEALADTPPELTDADMPSLDSLHAGSDVSMFFSKGVSQALRQQALRRLFHQPEFNVRCPLDEYAEDYSQMATLSSEAAGQLRSWAKDRINNLLDTTQQPDEQNLHEPEHHQSAGTTSGDQQPATAAGDAEQQHQLPEQRPPADHRT
ncbi:DUF3306 domain-containing protein [Marinospirillum alkaliphilum]|uniref:DUF3306 domain-containing protein n=1 Tax=Marinospirillum alkaliphilum DSM 21637 TaxID=1122209 RepID=A0A1K1XZN9_9GAMM|nr:DUF3306 domain-containing protein [Marinospirillum alkaliphilum]SFX55218.1 Protein of unknown function [Marinospirillum alkaliphilum DSM 21637]